MSRILFDAMVHGRQIPVAVGWDRRLGEVFCSISDHHLEEEDYEDPKFEPVVEASVSAMSRGLDPVAIQQLLDSASMKVPSGVFERLEEHIKSNAGNVIVRFDGNGNEVLLYDEERGINNVEAAEQKSLETH